MRSFTLPRGFENSPLIAMVAGAPAAMRLSLMSGVFPTLVTTLSK